MNIENTEIRWQQRFKNYQKALNQLQKFIDKGALNELEAQGLIQAFEYTFELAWNVLSDYLKHQGTQNIFGSRDAIQESFRVGILENGEAWMQMIKDRNQTAHTYNEEVANSIVKNIQNSYFQQFMALKVRMDSLL